jgi:hypothetical protein
MYSSAVVIVIVIIIVVVVAVVILNLLMPVTYYNNIYYLQLGCHSVAVIILHSMIIRWWSSAKSISQQEIKAIYPSTL